MRRGRYCWGTCRACQKQVHVERLAINRARGPRCDACGGIVDVSNEQVQRMTKARERKEDARAQRQGDSK